MIDLYYPIVDDLRKVNVAGSDNYNRDNHTVVGMLVAQFYWRAMIRNILPPGSNGIYVVVSNPCSDSFTYQIDGPSAMYVGAGDHHEKKYKDDGIRRTLRELGRIEKRKDVYSGARLDSEFCPISVHVYPSSIMESDYTSWDPIIFTVAVLCIFAFTSLVFYLYDTSVERRQRSVMKSAVQSRAIVSSLFPSVVRHRLYVTEEPISPTKPTRLLGAALPESPRGKIQSFLRDHRASRDFTPIEPTPSIESSAPIAELYPDTTILFADISGFTAWSSVRQPGQVFHLLETLYAGFDSLARKRGVFKVETIGDCYVAAVGLPTPRKHHAVVMARFAHDCHNKMKELTAKLETTLGPGTGELALRIGLNSGPTTAGVLRGEKSRFQLFGDTVNTAARMESNGERNRIQVSQKTADLIKLAGKEHWLVPRADTVECKGKGKMATYWCEPKAGHSAASSVSDSSYTESVNIDSKTFEPSSDEWLHRLVDWNVDMFTGLLEDIVSNRVSIPHEDATLETIDISYGRPRDEIVEVLDLPRGGQSVECNHSSPPHPLSPLALAQLRGFICKIAQTYRSNAFHNFDHCSHVAMSTKKLLDRVEEQTKYQDHREAGTCESLFLDPITKFAVVFAALIHDADHPGVSNAQLVQEDNALAVQYDAKSVAEQNSINVAWEVFMEPGFADLRRCVCSTDRELRQFRDVVVHAVLATDLFDVNLKSMRENRWTKSFGANSSRHHLPIDNALNRRVTIVIELIIQASDVSHTMQHFTVYKKWNMNLLREMYLAYKRGHTSTDPTIGWYEGELWFFDNYIIPLAHKLRECKVFGVSTDEFLDYAQDNRAEWKIKGQDIVETAKCAFQNQQFEVATIEV